MSDDDEQPRGRPETNHPVEPTEDVRRRRFLYVSLGVMGAGVAATVACPAVPFLLHPLLHDPVGGTNDFVPVGKLTRFGKEPVKVDLFADKTDAWNRTPDVRIGSAWVVELEGELVAFSTVCPHLGCAVDWEPTNGIFKCPCHRSAFSRSGRVEDGPSPRPLDRLEVQVTGDRLAILYRRYRQGIADKEPV